MDEFTDIIKKMTATQPADMPAGFTARVMEHILREPVGIRDHLRRIFSTPARTFTSESPLSTASIRNECAFYYFLAGTFFLITGIVLMLGLAGATLEGAMARWFLVQPHLMIVAALWLSILGGIVYLNDRTKVEAAKIATLIYILFVFISGAVVMTLCRMPLLMAATGLFVLSGVAMGFLLHQNISHYQESLPN